MAELWRGTCNCFWSVMLVEILGKLVEALEVLVVSMWCLSR